MYNGILNIYKEKGFTSHDVVAKLRGILKQKKIGHTGTLDPDAAGVLPVCLGGATKLCDMITDKTKTYEAVLLLGQATDTQDISGTVVKEYPDKEEMRKKVSDEEIRSVIQSFAGEYEQLPPMYSAIKVNGRKLYELAREGKEVERKTRNVHIYSIEILKLDFPRAVIRVECSKGTYIRTLCNDIGEKLGVFGCMEELKRTKSGPFFLENALKLSEIEELAALGTVEEHIISVEKMFEEYPAVTVKEIFDKILQNGNPLRADMVIAGNMDELQQEQPVRVRNSRGQFMAVYRYQKQNNLLKPYKMFHMQG